jgi:hypothetical protein
MTMCFFGFGYHWRKFGREMLNDYGSYSICPRENRRAVGSIAVAQSVVGEIAVYRHGPWFSMPSQSLSGLSLNVGEIVLAQSAVDDITGYRQRHYRNCRLSPWSVAYCPVRHVQ